MSNSPLSDFDAAAIWDTWLGPLDSMGTAQPAFRARWFKKDPDFDEALRERFGALLEAALSAPTPVLPSSDRILVAHVLLRDQLSRNILRGSGRMYAGDAQALALCEDAVHAGRDAGLAFDARRFLYMPLMHSESLEAQERCVTLFAQLVQEQSEARLRESAQASLDFARQHQAIVARFGRFPHRNALLNRASTPEEVAFLQEPGSSF